MSEKAPKNFVEYFHNTNWLEPYLAKRVDVGSLINTSGRRCESLNGRWTFAVDPYATALRAEWHKDVREQNGRPIPPNFDFEAWDEIQLPDTWNTAKPEFFRYEGYMAFTRTFPYRKAGNERVFINFEGVQYRAYIFLNTRYLGAHFGGSTPFSIEATDYLQRENRIFVVVDNTRRDEHVPMSNTDWFNYGGIYREIDIVRVPQEYIRNYRVHLVPDGSYSRIRLEVIAGAGKGKGPSPEAHLSEATVSIPQLDLRVPVSMREGHGSVEVMAKPELWSPENPKLYDVKITLGMDAVHERVGFREISVSGTDVLLNGEKLFFRGVACHEESVSGGKHLSETEVRHDLSIARELGCNYMRLAHYPHSRRTAQIADEMGIMLWEEIPVYWAIDFANPATAADAENQLRELIERDWNRASVVIWSVGNENPDTDDRLAFMRHLADTARFLDGTRPVSAACLVNHVDNRIEDRLADSLDIIGLNEYFGWYDPDYEKLPALFRNSDPDKPVFITEFGGGALGGHRGTVDEFFTEDRQRSIYERQIETFRSIPYLKGVSPWVLFDFRSPRRTNGFQRGYNRKGLLTEDKSSRKAAFSVLQSFYREW